MTKSEAKRAEINARAMREHYEKRSRAKAIKTAKEMARKNGRETAPRFEKHERQISVEGVSGLVKIVSWSVAYNGESRAFGDEEEARDYYDGLRRDLAAERSRKALISRLLAAKKRAIDILKTEADYAVALSGGNVSEEEEEALKELREIIALLS